MKITRKKQIVNWLREAPDWVPYDYLTRKGLKNADDRRERELVEDGIVEKKENNPLRYALFRLVRPKRDVLFDVPPDPMLIRSTRGAK
jgi:hypothetical protein